MSDELCIVTQDNTPNNIDQEIHIYKQSRGKGKKIDSIVVGLEFPNKDESKIFLSSVKKKFGAGGCQKEMAELSKDKLVFVFTGDLTDKLKILLVNNYGKNIDLIKIHG
jgi:translation initiation factor 1 (eIF-1/SUI1)